MSAAAIKPVFGADDPLDPGLPPTGTDGGVPGASGSGDGVREWCLGAFWDGNHPACVHFHEDRLCFAGAPESPDRVDMSNTSEYDVFSPSKLLDGTVSDSNAVSFSFNSNTVNAVRWMQTDQHGLVCGTAGGVWVAAPSAATGGITPTSLSAKQINEYGMIPVPPLHVGKNILSLQLGGRKLRTTTYNFAIDGFEGQDLTPLSEHLTVGGFTSLAIQRNPYQILWLTRADGTLVSVSYDSEQDEVAFASHPLGGVGDADGNPPKVLSVECIPSPDGTRDEVWLAVQRYVNGATVVYIERMSKIWEVGDQVLDASGDFYRYVPSLTSYADASQRLVSGSPVTTVSGLTWLEGETVGVLADGATHADKVVSGGSITLDVPAKDIVVGLKYQSIGRTLPVEAGGADGPAQGKLKRIHKVIFDVYESSEFATNPRGDAYPLQPVTFRQTNDTMDEPVPLRTGAVTVSWEGTYDTLGQVEFHADGMQPLNLSGMSIQLETQDGG